MASRSIRGILGGLVVLAACAAGARGELVPDKPMSYEGDPGMMARHEAIVGQVRKMKDAKIIFIGDSITQFWENAGQQVWARYYAPRKALNLGISGDRTQGCLWRLDNGELEGLSPKLAVILIGTNNTWGDEVPVEGNVRGIQMIVEKVRAKCPKARILLLGLLPREDPNTNGKWKKVNEQLVKLKLPENTQYLEIGESFLDGKGQIARGFGGDKLHLAAEGYRLWAEAIEPYVAGALGEKPLPPQGPAIPLGHLRKFEAKTADEAEAWRRESLAIVAGDRKLATLLTARRVAGAEKEYGVPLAARVRQQADKGKYTRQEVSFAVFENWTVAAIVTVPKGPGPFPAVVLMEGKVEKPYENALAAGTALANAGYITLSLDVQGDGFHRADLGAAERLVPALRAVDYLSTRPEVDKEKIGIAGLDQWGMLAVLDAAFDPRIKAIATAGVAFKTAPNKFIPTVAGDPHDVRDCYALLAPRPTLLQIGKADANQALYPTDLELVEVRAAYRVLGAAERFEVLAHPGGHVLEGSSLVGFFGKAFGGAGK